MQREEEEGTEMIKGIERFRQAIKNQRDLGNGDFRLAYHDAEEIADEIEDELARLSWAKGVPAPRDADGEVVPLTTKAMFTDKGEMVRVGSICYAARLWYVRRMHSDKTYWLNALHCTERDSWERLEKDALKAPRDYVEGRGITTEPGGRVATMVSDILRRAKALARRDAKEAGRG